MLMARRDYFALSQVEALAILAEVHGAVLSWRRVACAAEVGLRPAELADFAPAFEHEQMLATSRLLSC